MASKALPERVHTPRASARAGMNMAPTLHAASPCASPAMDSRSATAKPVITLNMTPASHVAASWRESGCGAEKNTGSVLYVASRVPSFDHNNTGQNHASGSTMARTASSGAVRAAMERPSGPAYHQRKPRTISFHSAKIIAKTIAPGRDLFCRLTPPFVSGQLQCAPRSVKPVERNRGHRGNTKPQQHPLQTPHDVVHVPVNPVPGERGQSDGFRLDVDAHRDAGLHRIETRNLRRARAPHVGEHNAGTERVVV